MAQVQCPNCGGYKINTEKAVTIASVKRQTSVPIFRALIGLGVLACVLLYGVARGDFLAIGSTALLIAIVGFLLFRSLTGQLTEKVPSIVRYDLGCLLCGYRWTWQNDQPYPKVNVNSALIQQGELRLQEDEHRRREQQQREMEAAWLLEQQRKKRS